MKGFTLALLVVACAWNTQAKEKNDVAKDKLKGKVKSVHITGSKLKIVAGKPVKDKTIFTSYSKYNDNGKILEFFNSTLEDTLEDEAVKFNGVRSIYKYDEEGNLNGKINYRPDGAMEDSSFFVVDNKGSRVDWYTYKANGTEDIHTISEYNIHGDIIELTEYAKGKFKSKTTYTYDAEWKETDEISYDEKGAIRWKEVFKYDEAGNLVEVTDYNADDGFAARFMYRYDDRGNMAQEIDYYSDTSTRNKKTTTKYDLDGAPKEINHFNHNGRLVNQIKVDNMGLHFTEVSYNDDESLKSVHARKYDDKANLILEDRFFTKDSVRIKYAYKMDYDKQGNWVKNTTSKNSVPIQVTERKIEYYTDPKKK